MSTFATLTKLSDSDAFEPLCHRIAAQGDLARALEALIDGIAHEVKATSNDQNVQRLARRLHAHRLELVASVVAKRSAP